MRSESRNSQQSAMSWTEATLSTKQRCNAKEQVKQNMTANAIVQLYAYITIPTECFVAFAFVFLAINFNCPFADAIPFILARGQAMLNLWYDLPQS